ncbi:MAG: glycosyltransferase family 4 protein [Nocardioidaceae bacterium]
MNSTLSVAMPMLTLVPGGMGGTETYARELTRELESIPFLSLKTIVPARIAGFSPRSMEIASSSVTGGDSTVGRIRSQAQASRSQHLRAVLGEADVIHYPFTVPVPFLRRKPRVLTIHDLQHRDLPANFSKSELAYRRVTYDAAARQARAVITVSEFSRRRIVDRLRLPPDRVHVAPLGVNLSEFRPDTGPKDNFVLYPARGWPHKNHARLIRAMHLVRHSRPDLRLVLTGGNLSIGSLPAWVENRGLVSRQELIRLYRSASCLAFPSLYEGFGLPPLEGMASGCPVAASDAGSLPEICGDAAVMFDARNPELIAAAILQAVNQGPRLIEAGFKRAARFTWRRCAEAHVAVYQEVARTRSASH